MAGTRVTDTCRTLPGLAATSAVTQLLLSPAPAGTGSKPSTVAGQPWASWHLLGVGSDPLRPQGRGCWDKLPFNLLAASAAPAKHVPPHGIKPLLPAAAEGFCWGRGRSVNRARGCCTTPWTTWIAGKKQPCEGGKLWWAHLLHKKLLGSSKGSRTINQGTKATCCPCAGSAGKAALAWIPHPSGTAWPGSSLAGGCPDPTREDGAAWQGKVMQGWFHGDFRRLELTNACSKAFEERAASADS